MKLRGVPMVFWGILLVGVVALAYVRLAPTEPERWHKQAYPSGMGERLGKKSYVWREAVEGDGAAQLQAMVDVVARTPRTTVVAGSVDARQITFVSRSQVFGFPDYTTIGVYEGRVEDGVQVYFEIYARARFGGSDLGVNAKRVRGWLSAIQ